MSASRDGNMSNVPVLWIGRGLVLLFCAVLVLSEGWCNAAPLRLITNAFDVFHMQPDDASNGHPVRLDVVVTYSDPVHGAAFVQDDSGGVFVFCGETVPPNFGERVILEGFSLQGMYGSAVRNPTFESLGRGKLPEPLRPGFVELQAGRVDSRWVQVEGTIRSAITNDMFLVLSLEMAGSRLKIICLDRSRPEPEQWVDARVRVRGVAGGIFNARDQFIASQLCVTSLDQIEVLQPPVTDPFSLPITPVNSLGRHVSGALPGQRIRVVGTVTMWQPGRALFLRDTDGSIEVHTSQDSPVQPGDIVDVIGFYERGEYSLIIADGTYRRVGSGTPVPPVVTSARDLNTGRFDSVLVTTTARLIEWQHRFNERTLLLQAGNMVFPARIEGTEVPDKVPAGSLVQLTGVCRIRAGDDQQVGSFEILLRTPDDVQLLEPPSFWNARRAYWLLGGSGAVLILVLAWVALLREQVGRQTRVLKEAIADHERIEEELSRSVSLLNATLESTTDGILVVDLEGRITNVNAKFGRMWRLSAELMASRDDSRLIEAVLAQIKDPDKFLQRIRELYADRETQSEDVIEFKDGRVFERYSHPQRVGDRCVGRVWSFRDVTEQRKAQAAVRESQALYHSLVEQLAAGVFRKDANGRYVFANSWFCQFKNRKLHQLLGRTPQEIAEEEAMACPAYSAEYLRVAAQSATDHEQVMSSGQHIEIEEKHIQPDGHSRYLHVVTTPILDSAGKVVGSQGVLFDVTRRKRAESALAETSNLMETLLDNSPDYIYFKDRESRFLRHSRAFLRKLGLPDHESLRGKTDFDIFDEAHARPAFEDEQHIIRTGEPIIGKTEKEVLLDGRVCWVLTSKIPLRDSQRRIIGTFGISKDVTAIKEAEAKLEEAHKRLLVISRQAGMAEVATSVLHNVGNVLNSVNVSTSLVADTLKRSKLQDLERLAGILRSQQDSLVAFLTADPRGRQLPEYLGLLASHLMSEQTMLMQEIEQTRKNIGHIKDIVMMQQGYAKISGVTEKLRATDLAEEAVKINEVSLTRHDIRVVRNYSAAETEFTVDRHKVLQILVNLIRNAQWACDEARKREKRITVEVLNGGEWIRFVVADNGVGISPENLTRIFQHGFTTRKDGHGFGLHSGAIAARELGGSLRVESEGPGTGARFTLELPMSPPAEATSASLDALEGVEH